MNSIVNDTESQQLVQFSRGPSKRLPVDKIPGTFLLETDTGTMYCDDTEENRVQIKDPTKLPLTGGEITGELSVQQRVTSPTFVGSLEGNAKTSTAIYQNEVTPGDNTISLNSLINPGVYYLDPTRFSSYTNLPSGCKGGWLIVLNQGSASRQFLSNTITEGEPDWLLYSRLVDTSGVVTDWKRYVAVGTEGAVGSLTQGIYLSEEGTLIPCTYTVEKSVPPDAVFTDHTYSAATATSDGLMSKEDKARLDSLVWESW